MIFDFTNGKTAKYIVSAYQGFTEDHWYYHYYRDAKATFNRLKDSCKWETVNCYDMVKDVRKNFWKKKCMEDQLGDYRV